jgi:GT2 family glycosyltransferase
MRVTVIIVNYNVRYFLEQCLCSVEKAAREVETEIIVVDNASSDGSRTWLEPRFPHVRFLWNLENNGFAKANNQALSMATGDFILFLNPDTIIPENTLKQCISFMDAHSDAGALGVRMLDGSGSFLRESKRAFPSPMTSFFKLSGLSGLFPRSSVFARYHLGHLEMRKDHEVEVLAGAFMFIRRVVLEKIGGFDEVFFMYGEDIDLSYRIRKAGYRNYYLADPAIIHFKGESTKKGSLNHVAMFYNAMGIFVRKHYGGARAGLFHIFITIAIWIRALLTAVGNLIRRVGLPLIDAVLILIAFWLAKYSWSHLVKPDIIYSRSLLTIAFPAFTCIYLLAAYYAGLYDRYEIRGRLVRSTMIATVAVLTVYSLLPEQYRFSRAILLLGSLFSFTLLYLSRYLLLRVGVLSNESLEKRQTLVAGTSGEYARVMELMGALGLQDRVLGRVAVDEGKHDSLTTLEELVPFIRSLPVREVIFCENSLRFSEIIRKADELRGRVRIRITAQGSGSIVGSDSKDSSGDTFSMDRRYQIDAPENRRGKRGVDMFVALIILSLLPLHFFFNRHPFGMIANAFRVLGGTRTWIGYTTTGVDLPRLRRGVLGSNGWPIVPEKHEHSDGSYLLDQLYARDYSAFGDIERVWKGYGHLGEA